MKQAFFDLDGVVMDSDWRSRLAVAKKWDLFHSLCEYDEPIDYTITEIRHLYEFRGVGINLITGRTEAHRNATVTWLADNKVPFHKLYMRADGDYSKASLMKLAILKEQFVRKDIAIFVDDNPPTIREVSSYGVPTVLFDANNIKAINAMREILDDIA